MGTFFLVFILPFVMALLLAWKRILLPVTIALSIAGVIFWKVTGYMDIAGLSMMYAIVGICHEYLNYENNFSK